MLFLVDERFEPHETGLDHRQQPHLCAFLNLRGFAAVLVADAAANDGRQRAGAIQYLAGFITLIGTVRVPQLDLAVAAPFALDDLRRGLDQLVRTPHPHLHALNGFTLGVGRRLWLNVVIVQVGLQAGEEARERPSVSTRRFDFGMISALIASVKTPIRRIVLQHNAGPYAGLRQIMGTFPETASERDQVPELVPAMPWWPDGRVSKALRLQSTDRWVLYSEQVTVVPPAASQEPDKPCLNPDYCGTADAATICENCLPAAQC